MKSPPPAASTATAAAKTSLEMEVAAAEIDETPAQRVPAVVPRVLPTGKGDETIGQMVSQVKTKIDKEFKEFELKAAVALAAAATTAAKETTMTVRETATATVLKSMESKDKPPKQQWQQQ